MLKAGRKKMLPYLFALEESLLVTVGDVQRECQDPGSVLHALNEIIQSSPAGALQTHNDVNTECFMHPNQGSKCP